jgi:hypothetical protein
MVRCGFALANYVKTLTASGITTHCAGQGT